MPTATITRCDECRHRHAPGYFTSHTASLHDCEIHAERTDPLKGCVCRHCVPRLLTCPRCGEKYD